MMDLLENEQDTKNFLSINTDGLKSINQSKIKSEIDQQFINFTSWPLWTSICMIG